MGPGACARRSTGWGGSSVAEVGERMRLAKALRCVKLPDHNTWVTVPAGAAVRIHSESDEWVLFRRAGAVTYQVPRSKFYQAVGVTDA